MATNAFSLMMGAARAIIKPIPPPAPAVDHVDHEGQARLQYRRREISRGSRSPSSSEGERQKL